MPCISSDPNAEHNPINGGIWWVWPVLSGVFVATLLSLTGVVQGGFRGRHRDAGDAGDGASAAEPGAH